MSTTIRPELSKKNKYHIDKHRYYELKHFCLQYPIWKKRYLYADGYKAKADSDNVRKTNAVTDPTFHFADERIYWLDKMKLIEQAAIGADPDIANYILRAVTEGLSYTTLKTYLNIPCGKDMYYDRYRRFFWLLDQARK